MDYHKSQYDIEQVGHFYLGHKRSARKALNVGVRLLP